MFTDDTLGELRIRLACTDVRIFDILRYFYHLAIVEHLLARHGFEEGPELPRSQPLATDRNPLHLQLEDAVHVHPSHRVVKDDLIVSTGYLLNVWFGRISIRITVPIVRRHPQLRLYRVHDHLLAIRVGTLLVGDVGTVADDHLALVLKDIVTSASEDDFPLVGVSFEEFQGIVLEAQ